MPGPALRPWQTPSAAVLQPDEQLQQALQPPAALLPAWLALVQQQHWPVCHPAYCAAASAAVRCPARCRPAVCSPQLHAASYSQQLLGAMSLPADCRLQSIHKHMVQQALVQIHG